MAALVRTHDWSATPLGPVHTWPAELCCIVDMILVSPQIASLVVGAERVLLYNDAAAMLYGDNHPAALGRPLPESWPLSWPRVAAFYERVFTGESIHVPAQPLDVARPGAGQVFDAYLVPIRNRDGTVLAAYMTGFEIGARIKAEAALRATQEHDRTGLERQVAAGTAELQASRDLLGAIVGSSPDMIEVFDAIRDDSGTIVDFRWVMTNRTSDPRSGYNTGRSMLENNPGVIVEGVFDSFKRVAETGLPEQAERHYVHEQFDGWFFQTVVKLGDGVASTTKDITDWKESQNRILRLQEEITQAKLERSEQRFRALVTAGATSIYRMSPDWRILYELDGDTMYATADPIENWLEKYVPDDERPVVAAAVTKAILTRSLFELEHRVVRNDGTIGWILSRAVPLLAVDGRIVEWFGVASDITAHHDTAERARVSNERLQQFGDASQDVLWIRNARTLQWEYLTAAFESIYGLPREEALAGDNLRNWEALVIEADRAQAVANLMRARAGTRVNFEYSVRRPSDGEIRCLRCTAFPIRDAAGTVVRIGGVASDITRVRTIEAEIAASEARLRTLMEGIPQLVWRSYDDGMWTWSSPQWQAFTGQGEEESRGMGWLAAVHPDDHEATARAWQEAAPHGMLDIEFRVRRAADAAWLWHHTRSLPVRDASGAIIEWLGTTTDVHVLHLLQERLGVLVAELQHRTRNLITVVRSLSDRTIGNASSLVDFKNRFDLRLAALARVQGLLSQLSGGARVDFDDVLRLELAALGVMDDKSDRVTLDGPTAVPLRSATVQTLALALHELATNALKYGALSASADGGRLHVHWRVDAATETAAPRLHVDWHESGVDMTAAGGGRTMGYGRELIERALPYQLGAETTYVMGGDGVRCTIAVPIAREEMRGM